MIVVAHLSSLALYKKILDGSSVTIMRGNCHDKSLHYLNVVISIVTPDDEPIRSDVYGEKAGQVNHMTPYTTWLFTIDDARSGNISLADVTAVKITFIGSAVTDYED